MTDPVRAIADAVLYEGYVLWPYRRSATKNQRRWTFGGVHPRAYSEAHAPDDPWRMQTQCLVEGERPAVEVTVRFLHVVARRVQRLRGDDLEAVDELVVEGTRHLSWDEALEREVRVGPVRAGETRREPVAVAAGRAVEPLAGAGAIERTWEGLAGAVAARVGRAADGLFRVTVEIENETPWDGADREQALRRTFCSTHTVLHASGGAFVSPTDPPVALRAEAEACENVGTWPVLVGPDRTRDTVLSSPIILPDYPEIAPESPGDLFDATEIDRLLILNVLSLTPEEQDEVRATDPRAREILDRCAGLSRDELMRLHHGAIRELAEARRP